MPETLYLTPAPLDIVAYQGDPFGMKVTVTDEAGDPLDLTGYTAQMHVREAVADLDPTIEATATATVSGPTMGEVDVVIDKDSMAALSGRHRYDLEIVDSGGQPQTILAGYFTVRQEVTR